MMAPRNDDDFEEWLRDGLASDRGPSSKSVGSDPNSAQEMDADDAADLALLREALGNYRAETLRFAEQQSATMPVPVVNKAATLWHNTPRWALAATAVMALGCTTLFVAHHSTQAVPVSVAAAPTAQVLADDNQLLLSVNQALLPATVAPSEEELGLTTDLVHSTKRERATN